MKFAFASYTPIFPPFVGEMGYEARCWNPVLWRVKEQFVNFEAHFVSLKSLDTNFSALKIQREFSEFTRVTAMANIA